MPSSRLPRLVTGDNTSPSLLVDHSPTAAQDRGNTLPELLASLKHFDLTGSVRRKENVKGVGRGYYDVHEGYYLQRNGNHAVKVAIKRYRARMFRRHIYTKIVRDEIQIWSKLHHSNILAFVGYALESEDRPLLISEWMENGSVNKYVKNHSNCDIHQIVTGIAEGLTYLHSEEIIHGDIRADNVLISSAGQPQIYSFGSSRICSQHGNVTESPPSPSPQGPKGSLRWMAPDFFQLGNTVTVTESSKKTDVWAFGMTIYEMLTGTVPYSNITQDFLVIISLTKLELPPAPEGLSALPPQQQFLWSICEYCWLLPELRPEMTTVCHALGTNDEEVRKILDLAFVTLRLRRTLLDFQQYDLSGKITQKENYSRYHGGFSDVYFGQSLVHNKDVAIKRVRYRLHDDLTFLKRMVRELQIWVRLVHKNILPLLGYTTDGGLYYLSLITEWMDNKTVIQYMKSKKGASVNVLNMVKGIASGLAYLHSQNVVHSDLKSGNVLISAEGEPLLADFGISHMLSSCSIIPLTSGLHGTGRWMAYEQLFLDSQISTPYTFKTDVWSFGMTVLELLTLKVPYAHLTDALVTIAIYKKELPPRPEAYNSEWSEERKRLWAICESCWNIDSGARPSIDAVIHELNGI